MVWFFMGEVKEQNGCVSDYGDRYKNLYVYHSVDSNSLQPNGSRQEYWSGLPFPSPGM